MLKLVFEDILKGLDSHSAGSPNKIDDHTDDSSFKPVGSHKSPTRPKNQFLSEIEVERLIQALNPVSATNRSGMWEYGCKTFVVLRNSICMTLSALVPTAAILLFYFIKTMIARLATVSGMSSLFSLIMMVIFQGRRMDVFGATAAFAAIKAVCVGPANFISSSW